jgi:hypothetical protein
MNTHGYRSASFCTSTVNREWRVGGGRLSGSPANVVPMSRRGIQAVDAGVLLTIFVIRRSKFELMSFEIELSHYQFGSAITKLQLS